MEVIAKTKSVRISPRKVRLVADSIRRMSALEAVNKLSIINKRAALTIAETLKSAIANGVNNFKVSEASLFIKGIEVDEGPFLKRFRPSTRGRVHPYKKRSSNIKIILEEAGK
ncbi:50S ribosomal protein L22 [Candidatus Microgenomates bacterium]|nr:MAG: 50S ribosomal protein L22 [Candidatus Microgenomates bacterium]